MRRIVGFIMIFIFIGCFCQCSDKIDYTLKQAELIMTEMPDSALNLLQSIDKNSLNSDRQKALYALLLSQALDKNYIDITDDSIISIAVNYFEYNDEPHYAMLAHYYNANIASNANRYSDCIIECMKAENIAKSLNDNFYLGMIYRQYAYIHNHTCNYIDELNYNKLSYNYFCKTNKVEHIKYAYLDLATSYNNTKQFDKSITILENIINNPDYKNDTVFICEALSKYAHVQWLLGNYNKTLNTIQTIQSKYKYPLNALDYAHLTQLYIIKGDIDSANYYLKKAKVLAKSTIEKSTIENAIYRIHKHERNYNAAIDSKIRTNKIQDTIITYAWNQSLIKIQRDYFNQNAKLYETKAKYNVQLAITITIIAILIIIIGLLYYYHYRTKQNIRIENLKKLYSTLEHNHKIEISKIQQLINELELKLKHKNDLTTQQENELIKQQQELKLLREQSELNEINKIIVENEIKNNSIINRLKANAKQNKIALKQDLSDLDEFINQQFPNFKSTLYSLFKLSELQYNVCLLIKADIGTTDIATLLCREKTTISNIKARIFNKIKLTNPNITKLDDLISRI